MRHGKFSPVILWGQTLKLNMRECPQIPFGTKPAQILFDLFFYLPLEKRIAPANYLSSVNLSSHIPISL